MNGPTTNPLVAFARVIVDARDDADLEARVRGVVAPGFVFRQDGRRDDVERYLDHLRRLRAASTERNLTVCDELIDRSTAPARAALRVTVRMRTADGAQVRGEALLIGALDGDRLAAVHEIGRLLDDGDDPPAVTR